MAILNPILATLITILILAIPLATARLLSILPPRPNHAPRPRGSKTHLVIILGSGGHTAEMISMLRKAHESKTLNWTRYTYRTWIISSGDGFSASIAQNFETQVGGTRDPAGPGYRILELPRARKIHQSLFTTPFSCLYCLAASLRFLVATSSSSSSSGYPDLVLANGPATSTIFIFATLLLRYLNIGNANSPHKFRTVYIESWARVKHLSLSGRLLSYVVDRVLVQWQGLQGSGAGGRAEFIGVLV